MPPDWPTGPVAAPVADPAPVAVPGECPDPECAVCTAARAGAVAIAAMVGVDYDSLDPVVQGHYRAVASAAYGAMSESLIATGAVVVGEET